VHLFLRLISSPWFWADVLLSVSGGVLVYLGLRLEKAAEKKEYPGAFVDEVKSRKLKAERGWRILMVGIVVEVVAAFGISVISGLEIADLSDKSAAANNEAKQAAKEAGRANERAAMVESNNAVLSLHVEELRSNNIALERQMQPRLIESSHPIKRLTQFAGTKAKIICATGGDCASTANQITAILQSAKWNVEVIRTEKAVPPGVLVGLSSSTNGLNLLEYWAGTTFGVGGKSQSHIAVAVLADELNNGGIPACAFERMYFHTSLRFDGIVIIVGPRADQLFEQGFGLENKQRELMEQMLELGESISSLKMSLTNQENAAKSQAELNRLRNLGRTLESDRFELSEKAEDLRRQLWARRFPAQTNKDGTFNFGYEEQFP